MIIKDLITEKEVQCQWTALCTGLVAVFFSVLCPRQRKDVYAEDDQDF